METITQSRDSNVVNMASRTYDTSAVVGVSTANSISQQRGGTSKISESWGMGGVTRGDTISKEGLRGDDTMDILEKYIEKVDRDQAELRNDIRESERRTAGSIAAIEGRMDKRIEKIESLLINHTVAIDAKISGLEDKTDSTNKWIMGVCLATIVGIATMVITVMVTLY